MKNNKSDFVGHALDNFYSAAVKFNTYTGKTEILRCDDDMKEAPSCEHITEFTEYFIKSQNICEDDAFKIRCISDLKKFREKCSGHESGTLVTVCRRPEGKIIWSRWMLAVPSDYSAEKPDVLIYQYNISGTELDEADIVHVMNSHIYSILKCSYVTSHISVIKLQGAVRKFRYRCSVRKFMSDETLDEQYLVHPDDLEKYRETILPENVMEYFSKGHREKNLIYRRMTGLVYRWVRLRIFPSFECRPDNSVYIFVIEDVHSTVSEFIQNNNMKQAVARAGINRNENMLIIKTFGNFEVSDADGNPVVFRRKKSREILAYLIDQYGYPVSTADIVKDVLEKSPDNKTSLKYVSALVKYASEDLEKAGFPDVIVHEWNSFRINVRKADCDYYDFIEGDVSALKNYHNEYMKEYSWAERTNAELNIQKSEYFRP